MDILELIRWIINGSLDLFLHGVYSGLAGVLGFFLTLWATRLTYTGAAYLLHSPTSICMELERGIGRFGYLVALFVSLSVHMWQDRLLGPF